MRHWVGLILCAIAAAPAYAYQDAPAEDSDPIIVRALRPGDTVAVVDYDKVWRRCAECKRALAKLGALAKPYHIKKGEIERDAQAYTEAVVKHASMQGQSERFLAMLPELQRQDANELITIRFDMVKLTASFLSQLDPHVWQAAESERKSVGAVAVFNRNARPKPSGKYRRLDITQAVIRKLDSTDFTIVLADPPAKSARR